MQGFHRLVTDPHGNWGSSKIDISVHVGLLGISEGVLAVMVVGVAVMNGNVQPSVCQIVSIPSYNDKGQPSVCLNVMVMYNLA